MYLSMEEIHEKFDGQWVYLINCKEEEYGDTIGGEVVLHSERRDKVIREMSKYYGEKSITLIAYAGKIPEEVSVIL